METCKEITGANSGLAKVAVQFSAENFVVNQTLVLRINICGKNRHLRQAADRCVALHLESMHFRFFSKFVTSNKLMTTKELKSEIQKTFDKVPENILQDILVYLKEIESQPKKGIDMARNLRTILTEDKSLLERLAR